MNLLTMSFTFRILCSAYPSLFPFEFTPMLNYFYLNQMQLDHQIKIFFTNYFK